MRQIRIGGPDHPQQSLQCASGSGPRKEGNKLWFECGSGGGEGAQEHGGIRHQPSGPQRLVLVCVCPRREGGADLVTAGLAAGRERGTKCGKQALGMWRAGKYMGRGRGPTSKLQAQTRARAEAESLTPLLTGPSVMGSCMDCSFSPARPLLSSVRVDALVQLTH